MEASDPTLGSSEPDRYWSTANTGEATPAVLSPLCWSFWGDQFELASRRSLYDFGILPRREVRAPDDPNQMFTACFYGRQAMNMDLLRVVMGSIPGTSADDFERDVAGTLREDAPPVESTLRRLPFIAAKAPRAFLTNGRRVERLTAAQTAWWQREVRDRTEPGDPRARLVDAAQRFHDAMHLHGRGRSLTQAIQAQITKVTASVNEPELAVQVFAGFGGVTETTIAEDLWKVARGDLDRAAFVSLHGFHGPNEGNVIGCSWREDPTPLDATIAALALRPDSDRPGLREAAATAAREAAVERLLGLLPRRKHSLTRRLVKLGGKMVRSTESSKAAFLMAIDGARAAARDLGRMLAADGVLAEADDVFFFTLPELVDGPPPDASEIAAFRKERREFYGTLEVPTTFTGFPEPVGLSQTESLTVGDVVSGLAGSAGLAKGRARVIVDPDSGRPLEAGEILVSRVTDPGWTPLFMLAEALVIDIGGPASHGAIIARELGIPCVINTGTGTRTIQTGDLIEVDGTRGRVTILERAGS